VRKKEAESRMPSVIGVAGRLAAPFAPLEAGISTMDFRQTKVGRAPLLRQSVGSPAGSMHAAVAVDYPKPAH
jgi:hypothetical protein